MTAVAAGQAARAPRVKRNRWLGKLAPYWMILPAWLWLVIFFVVPIVSMLSVSTMTGDDLAATLAPVIKADDMVICLGAGDITKWAAGLADAIGKLR